MPCLFKGPQSLSWRDWPHRKHTEAKITVSYDFRTSSSGIDDVCVKHLTRSDSEALFWCDLMWFDMNTVLRLTVSVAETRSLPQTKVYSAESSLLVFMIFSWWSFPWTTILNFSLISISTPFFSQVDGTLKWETSHSNVAMWVSGTSRLFMGLVTRRAEGKMSTYLIPI